MIGKTILHYNILEKLGEGGMGVVYKAEDTKLKREVAIKFLPKRIATNDEERERFKIEAQAAAALNHPNIAHIYAIEEADDEMFIVMEYINGQELKNTVKSQIPNPKSAIDYATQIAEGLQAAHKKGIVHRDIKSSNIMITNEGKIKIMDFGLAKVRGGAQVTKVGTTIGTAAYMSPEQARGEEADHRSDIWSFGVVLYEMLTSGLPFGGDYEQAVIYSVLNEEPDYPQHIPSQLIGILQKSLAKNSNDRYQHLDELLADLRSQDSSEQKLTELSKTKQSPTHSSQVKRYIFAAIAIIVLIFVVISIPFFRSIFSDKTEAINTLAILPFENQNTDSEFEYLSDGIPETVIFKLSKLPGLKVRSLSSVWKYRGASIDVNTVGSELDVQAILTGHLSLRGDNIAIVVELVNTHDNTTIWGNTYQRNLTELLTIQEDITNDILSEIKFTLSGEEQQTVNRRATENSEAYQAYLKGRYFEHRRTEDDFRKALDYYQQAIDIDPQYALAYAGKSDTYFLLSGYSFISVDEASPKAREAAEAALRIDQNLAEAYLSMAAVHTYFDWDWSMAELELKKAIQLNPQYANNYHHYSYFLSYLGRYQEAIETAKKGLELDPLSPVLNRGLGIVYLLAREYDNAVTFINKCLELNPNSISGLYYLIFAQVKNNHYDEAIAAAKKLMLISGDQRGADAMQKDYEKFGYKAALLHVANSKKINLLSDPGWRGYLFGLIDKKEQCLELLQRAIRQKSGSIALIKVHPALDALRDDSRLIALINEIEVFSSGNL